MNVKKLRVRKEAYKLLEDKSILIHKKIKISSQYIIKTNLSFFYPVNKKAMVEWIIIYLDRDYYHRSGLGKKLKVYLKHGSVFSYGRKSYGILWDVIVNKEQITPINICYYCERDVTGHEKITIDHVVPQHIYKALGIKYIPNNTIQCCKKCNRLKANHHPYIFREIARRNMEMGSPEDRGYWSKVFKAMNRMLINKDNLFFQ